MDNFTLSIKGLVPVFKFKKQLIKGPHFQQVHHMV